MTPVAVKVCGVTAAADLGLLADSGVNLVGLWCGVPSGHADCTVAHTAELVAVAEATQRLRPVLVTLLGDVRRLRAVIDRTGARWVQLHGYQPPGTVRALKAAGDLTVVKVLHVGDGECLEQRLISAYERAGTDYFLLDSVAQDGRVGSTGISIDCDAAVSVADRLSVPFLLAGGISADNRAAYQAVMAHPRFYGVDVDTAARDRAGRLNAGQVSAIVRRWSVRHSARTATKELAIGQARP